MKTDSFLFRFGQALKPGRCFSSCLLLLACLSAHAQLDTDGDGLSNDDEAAIYFTNPTLADSDGDGMPDGLETQLGTDPRNPNSVFRIFVPVTPPGALRQVCWTSVSGQTYQLQNADPRTNGPGGGLVWRPVTTVTASSTNTCVSFFNPSGLYRVQPVVATNNDALPPLVSLIQAIPPLPGGASALLSVVARDLAGVVRVEFLDGANVLGTATRGAGDAWSFSWSLNINLNGRHHLRARAYDAAGNVGYSPVLAFNVSLGGQSCVTVGSVQICADSISNSNGTLRATGHVRAGGITFSADTVLTITGTQISGSGSVTVPGLGTVLTGSFDINATTGWLTVRVGTTPIYSGIVFNPRVTLLPTQLLLNVFSNSLCTSGSVTCQVPNHVFGPATFTGTVCFDPLAATLSAVGSMTMSSLSATGTAIIRLSDATFTLAGDTRLRASNGDVYTVSNGLARLTFTNGLMPNLYLQGRLGFPEGLALDVQGNIAADGSALLTGAGAGRINGYMFTTLTCTLLRPAGANTIITVNFSGRLAHANLTNFPLSGVVLSTGFLEASGTNTATFGGFTFTPFAIHAVGNVFSNQFTLNISGTLSLSYLEPINFQGTLWTDGSILFTGQSGPYTLATFGGALPRLDDPNVRFDKKVFIGAYHLLSRNSAVATTVDFAFAGNTNTANYVLDVTAVTTSPGAPTLTLRGNAATTGACSLIGSLAGQSTTIWGSTVNSLACRAARETNGVVTYEVTGGTLTHGGLGGVVAATSGRISSDCSGFIDFTFSTCVLNGYALENATLRLAQATNGTRSLSIVSGKLLLPGFLNVTAIVSGSLSNNGTFRLTGTVTAALTLTNLPVTSMAANASATLTQNGLTITGSMSGGVLGQIPAVNATGTLNVASNGYATASGCITVSPLTYDQFRLESTAPDGSFSACFTNAGLTFPAGARLLYRGSPLTLPALPSFTIAASGNFSISVSNSVTAGATLNGYSLPSLSFTLIRSGGVTFAQTVSAMVSVPGFNPGFIAATTTFSVTGSLNSDGTFNLTGNGGSSLALTGPVGVINASQSGSVNFRHSGLTVGGSVSAGVLSQIPVRQTAGGGLVGEYYDNIDFTGPKVTRVDAAIDFDWGNGQPDAGIGADSFSVRWSGWVRPEFSETYTFYTMSDDGVRLWVNNQLLIDNWTDHGPTEDFANITLQAGQPYQIRMEYYENGGGAVARLSWSSPGQPKEIIPSSELSVRPTTGGGLVGEYFKGIGFTSPTVTRIDDTIDFDWGDGEPMPGLGADTFAVRWTGWVQSEFQETYTFYTTSDDGVRLWVDNQLLFDNWTDHGPTENSATINLRSGQSYQIRMEYYENGGGALAKLSWSSPSQPKEIIPNTRLFQAAPVLDLSGFLDVAANGRVSVAGCVTVSPLVSGQFRLESTQPGGSFTACFGPNGLTVPTGARLLYRGSALTLPALPSFTIAANGNFSISVSNSMTAGVTVNGFNLPGFNFTLVRSGSVLAVQNVNATVSVPGISGGFTASTSFTVSGDLNSDGTFNLLGQGGGSLTLSGLPVGLMNVNASVANSVNFRDTGLTATVSCSGGVLGNLPQPLVSATASLTIFSNGSVTLAGTVTCLPLPSSLITIERLNGGNLQATLDNTGLRFSAWQVRVAGVFTVAAPLLPQTMSVDGSFNAGASVTPPNFTIANYGFTGVGFTVNRSSNGTLSIIGLSGTLFNVPGFTQRFLGGSINNAGSVTMDLDTTVTLGGFNTTSGGHLALRTGGLTASGTISFTGNGYTLGSFSVSVTVGTDGTYSTTNNVIPSLNIDGYSTGGSPLTLSHTGLRGTRCLNFGGLQVCMSDLSVSPSSVSGTGTAEVDTMESSHPIVGRWERFIDAPAGDFDDGYARLKGTVSLTASGNGNLNATLGSQTFAWWRVVCTNFCASLVYPPDDINAVQPPQRFTLPPFSISSSGGITVSPPGNPLGKPDFYFNLWD